VADRPVRLFIAIPLPGDAVDACAALIDTVRRGPLGRMPRWVHVPNLHLTLRFLGDTPEDLVPDVVLAVRGAVAATGVAAFQVRLAGAGWFPGDRKPRTLWLGIERGVDELARLAGALDPALAPLGWPPDGRPYRPHLTVARIDATSPIEGMAVAGDLVRAAGGWETSFTAGRVVVYRSRLGGGPPRHEPVDEVALPA